MIRTLRPTFRHVRATRLMSSKIDNAGSSDGVSSAPKDGTTMPHVNEEAVAYDNILGGQKSPTESEETVPVQDILKKSETGMKNAPKVIREGRDEDPAQQGTGEDATGASSNLKFKYELPGSDSVLTHLVGVIMKDGKKSQAQSRIQGTLELLQRATQRDALSSLKEAIERVSPLMKMIQRKQGSKNVPVPIPLSEKGRRRRAINWILEASQKRTGEKSFSARFAQELAAVLDGTSAAFQKKDAIHRLALVNRANASVKV